MFIAFSYTLLLPPPSPLPSLSSLPPPSPPSLPTSYEEVKVKNFTTSWKDGLAFCAIIDRHRPELLNYDDCDPDTPLSNLELAMSMAEKELGIVRIIDPEGKKLYKLCSDCVAGGVSISQALQEIIGTPLFRRFHRILMRGTLTKFMVRPSVSLPPSSSHQISMLKNRTTRRS